MAFIWSGERSIELVDCKGRSVYERQIHSGQADSECLISLFSATRL